MNANVIIASINPYGIGGDDLGLEAKGREHAAPAISPANDFWSGVPVDFRLGLNRFDSIQLCEIVESFNEANICIFEAIKSNSLITIKFTLPDFFYLSLQIKLHHVFTFILQYSLPQIYKHSNFNSITQIT